MNEVEEEHYKEECQKLLAACLRVEPRKLYLACELNVTRPTLDRWLEGTFVMRPGNFAKAKKWLAEKKKGK